MHGIPVGWFNILKCYWISIFGQTDNILKYLMSVDDSFHLGKVGTQNKWREREKKKWKEIRSRRNNGAIVLFWMCVWVCVEWKSNVSLSCMTQYSEFQAITLAENAAIQTFYEFSDKIM